MKFYLRGNKKIISIQVVTVVVGVVVVVKTMGNIQGHFGWITNLII